MGEVMRKLSVKDWHAIDAMADYMERERLKELGWAHLTSGGTASERILGVAEIIEAHYLRSREGRERSHPDLVEYSRHWLAANGHELVALKGHSPDILGALYQRFPRPRKLRIQPGHTIWCR